ncbi:MAG: twin-arginine translocase subunit TatC [Nitrospinae bacterium]|nr:twin-arginine translocase subunit TatC [Nitrospinota bacterium]
MKKRAEGEQIDDAKEGPLSSHLLELRKRVLISFGTLLVAFFSCFPFAEQIFLFLAEPIRDSLPDGSTFIFTHPAEAFFTFMKVSFIAAIFISIPVLYFQVWKFVAPGLYPSERKMVVPFVFFSTILFFIGGIFAYKIVFPFVFQFFISFTSETIKILPSVKEYISFVSKLLVAFGVVFQLPVLIYFLSRIGIVSTESLVEKRRYAIVGCFLLSAILTPPDVVSQVLMAFPLIILYEIGIWISKYATKRHFEESV